MTVLIFGAMGNIGRRIMPAFPGAIGIDRVAGADIVADLATIDYEAPEIVAAFKKADGVIHVATSANTRDPDAVHWTAVTATARLLAANGVVTDLETALFQADHGSPAEALAAARAEWSARRSIHTADALGWALHAAGRDGEALRYVRLATRLGTQDARLLFHRGAVESALGVPGAAGHLRAAQRLDAGTSPFRAAAIGALLGGAR